MEGTDQLAIAASALSKSYGTFAAVDRIDLVVGLGSVFGFLGPNGAGKSTTIKMLTTLIAPSSGSLRVLGVDAFASPLAIRKRIGVVLQQPSYEPSLSVERSLETYGMMWDVPRTVRQRRVPEVLEEFGLSEIRSRKMEDLSIGQRRRVQVAREFMHDMDLLFLDEPTVGLDPAARRNLLDGLKTRARGGLTIFYTTHVLSEAEYICDRIAIINRGKIVAVNTPEELKRRFGRHKTVTIRLSSVERDAPKLLAGISGCAVEFDTGTVITIRSHEAEASLPKALAILSSNSIHVENLSVAPVSLEEIFLEMVGEADAERDRAHPAAQATR